MHWQTQNFECSRELVRRLLLETLPWWYHRFRIVIRKSILYKLIRHGITDNIYKTIQSVYEILRYCVMVNSNVSHKLTSSNGVRQDCSWGPILSNIFQNVPHDIIPGCEQMKIDDKHVNNLSWADGLLYLSTKWSPIMFGSFGELS